MYKQLLTANIAHFAKDTKKIRCLSDLCDGLGYFAVKGF